MYINGRRIFNLIEWNKSNKKIKITSDGTYDVSDYSIAEVGDTPSDKFYVMVVDYDGTEIDYVELNDGETYTLPTPPTHSNLVFEEWSCSQDIVDNTVTIDGNNVMIGPIYNTVSGLSEFDILLTTNLSVTFYGPTESWLKINIDWGDGTVETELSPSSNGFTHVYAESGKYTIKSNTPKWSHSGNYTMNGLYEVRLSNLYTGSYFPPGTVENMSFSKNTMPNTGNSSVIECGGRGYLKALILPTYTQYRPSISYIRVCGHLKYIVIPKGFVASSQFYANSVNAGFYEDYSLKYVALPHTFTTKLGPNWMSGCYSIEQFVVPRNVTTLDTSCFSSLRSLKKIVLYNNITAIPTGCFNNCTNLVKVNIPNNVTSIGGTAFSGCTKLSNIEIPSNVTSIGTNAFDNTAVKTLIIPEAVTSITRLGSMPGLEKLIMLSANTLINYQYGALSSLPMKEAIVSGNISNTYQLFYNCYNLEKLTFLGENIKLPIGGSMFYNCVKLKEINGDVSFTSIANQGASYTASMKKWDMTGMTSASSIQSGVFYPSGKDFKIIVPDELYETLLTTSGWSNYAQYLVRDSDYVEEDE